tara:strand:+ start:201 stop:1046 length:846 start_codon:yes stop_codon:yes gene_type:complete
MSEQLKIFISNLNTQLNSVSSVGFDGADKEEKQKIISDICSILVEYTAYAHETKINIDWSPPQPEWFDHRCDQFFQFSKRRSSHWVERGVFGSLILKPSSNLLELCSGDGFNSYHFYSNRCNSVYAIDFDESAYKHAVNNYSLPNISFNLGDIRKDIPNKKFDAIIWDTAIEHFTEEEIFSIMKTIKECMNDGAVLSGHTIKENDTGEKQLSHHEREFTSKEDLAQFFEPYFSNVHVFETVHPDRHNYYFYASDSTLPFSDNWDSGYILSKDTHAESDSIQ